MDNEEKNVGLQEGLDQQGMHPQEEYPQWPYMQQPGQQYSGQQQPGQQQYPGQQYVSQKPKTNVLGVIGLIIAIVGSLMLISPVTMPLGLFLSIAACILGANGMRKSQIRNKFAIAGFIISLVNIGIFVIFIVYIVNR